MRILPLVSNRRYYVSLGDAQSRNDGGYTGAASGFYNSLLASEPSLRMIPLATDGATAATVRYVQLPRLREMDTAPDLVTITLGAGELSRLPFQPDAVCAALREHGNVVLATLRATNARLLLTTLYDPMDGIDPALAAGVTRFNETLRELASVHGAHIADIFTAFAGHGAKVGDPLSPETAPDDSRRYLCAGADLAPVPNAHGAAVFADILMAAYRAASTEETPLTSDRTNGLPL